MRTQPGFFLMFFIACRLICRRGAAQERWSLAAESTNGAGKQPIFAVIAKLARELTEVFELELESASREVAMRLAYTVEPEALEAEITVELARRLTTPGEPFVAEVLQASSVAQCMGEITHFARHIAYSAGGRLRVVQLDQHFAAVKAAPTTVSMIVSSRPGEPLTPAETEAFGSMVMAMGIDHALTESNAAIPSESTIPGTEFSGSLSYF